MLQARVPMDETVGIGHQAVGERWVIGARDAPRVDAKTAAKTTNDMAVAATRRSRLLVL